MTSLFKYYKIAALLPLGLTTVAGIILSIAHDGSKYRSEWFTDDGFVLTIFLTILLSGLIAILSLTALLHKHSMVKDNSLFSFLSWIVIPGALCAFVVYQEFLNFTGHSELDGTYEGNRLLDGFIMFMAILHLVGLITTYINFQSSDKLKDDTAANTALVK